MTRDGLEFRVNFLSTPAAAMLERGAALMRLATDGAKLEGTQGEAWRELAEAIGAALVAIRDGALESIRDSDRSVKLA